MSHLFKKNKFLLNALRNILYALIIIFIVLGLFKYDGNKLIYLLFSIVSNYLLFFAFRKKKIFFETFFSILIWLGFCFNLLMKVLV